MTMIVVELFTSPGCSRCRRAAGRLKAVLERMESEEFSWREVDAIREFDRAVALGVQRTPAVVIDDELVFTGLPSEAELRRALRERRRQP